MKNYYCPDCQSAIGFDDINVANDIALCRSCGNTHNFSIISSIVSDNSSLSMGKTPKHVKVKSEFMKGGEIKYSRISPGILFLIPFTCFWSGLSVYGIYLEPWLKKGRLPETPQMLMGLPFLIGTIVLVSIIIYMLFGKTVITLNKGKGDIFVGIGMIGWCRHFKYNTQSQVRLVPTSTKVNNVRKYGIKISTNEDDITFGALIEDKSKQYMTLKLKELIRTGI